MMSSPTLMVSLLPRGSASGQSYLAAVDLARGTLTAERPIPVGDYLADAEAPGHPVQHARGLALAGTHVWVGLFNAVRKYMVEDAATLRLTPGPLLTSPAAVDIHGLVAVGEGTLLAVSTGADAIIAWDLRAGAQQTIVLGSLTEADLRFPRHMASTRGMTDWRHVLPGVRHLNDVGMHGGKLIVCSLKRLLVGFRGRWRSLMGDDGAILHGAHPAEDGRILVTDAARGELLAVDPEAGRAHRVQVTDPGAWFLRGLTTHGDHLFLLRSERVASLQRGVGLSSGPPPARGARFGISVVSCASLTVEEEYELEVTTAPKGAVAYAAVAVA
jgi:hypothetical protein